MAGGGWGGHIVFPHPDDKEAGHLLDDVGGTNANDDDSNDTPPSPPPENNGDAPRGEGGRDDDGAGRQRDGSSGVKGTRSRQMRQMQRTRSVLGEHVICMRGRRRRHGSCIVP